MFCECLEVVGKDAKPKLIEVAKKIRGAYYGVLTVMLYVQYTVFCVERPGTVPTKQCFALVTVILLT